MSIVPMEKRIATLEALRAHLQTALELEHATIPPYFAAWLSANDDANPEAVQIIRTVMLEEMLHLTLAANLLNAVGGRPNLTHGSFIPRYPHRLPHSGKRFVVSIERFSKEALGTFLKIERPEAADAEPEAGEYGTIGQFYEAIAQGFVRLCQDHGEPTVFTGDPVLQVRPEDYYGSGQLVAVHDLESALRAIEEIKEQGEGAAGSVFDMDHVILGEIPGREPAHYFRFKELQLGRRYKNGDTPRTGPTGPIVQVNFAGVYPIAKNTRISDFAPDSDIRVALESFCGSYRKLLEAIETSFNGAPARLTEAMARMFDLKNQALSLMRTPILEGGETNVGLAFSLD